MADGVASLIAFCGALRDAGVPVGPARVRTFCEAAAVLVPEDLYWAGRAALLCSPDDIAVYDETFARFFALVPTIDEEDPSASPRQGAEASPRSRSVEDEAGNSAEGTASRLEVLQHTSFADCTADDWSDLAELLAALPPLLPVRRLRRYAQGRPGPIDVRRVLRSAGATGGEPIHLRNRRRRLAGRPLIFLLDVSGSMAAYSRGLLLFAHALARSAGPLIKVYAFGTRLTDITEVVNGPSFAAALRASEVTVPDWDGGTRIGDAIAALVAASGLRSETRRAVVLICSDGLDTGEPEFLADQAERLRRGVHRVVWLNPLKQDPEYEPLARGMQAALPHVDVFESGHSVAALLAVFASLRGGSRARAGVVKRGGGRPARPR
jgi:uncharacterized protein with von Willebrand factor type A (vWA) domain